jgi:hypothetical protein
VRCCREGCCDGVSTCVRRCRQNEGEQRGSVRRLRKGGRLLRRRNGRTRSHRKNLHLLPSQNSIDDALFYKLNSRHRVYSSRSITCKQRHANPATGMQDLTIVDKHTTNLLHIGRPQYTMHFEQIRRRNEHRVRSITSLNLRTGCMRMRIVNMISFLSISRSSTPRDLYRYASVSQYSSVAHS